MDDTRRRFWRVLRELGLALLNATLILVALCLWLAWEVVTTARSVTAAVAAEIVELAPVRGDIQNLTAKVEALGATLDALPEQTLAAAGATDLRREVVEMAALTAAVNLRLNRVLDQPEVMIDHAVEVAADAAASRLSGLAGCRAPEGGGGLPDAG